MSYFCKANSSVYHNGLQVCLSLHCIILDSLILRCPIVFLGNHNCGRNLLHFSEQKEIDSLLSKLWRLHARWEANICLPENYSYSHLNPCLFYFSWQEIIWSKQFVKDMVIFFKKFKSILQGKRKKNKIDMFGIK